MAARALAIAAAAVACTACAGRAVHVGNLTVDETWLRDHCTECGDLGEIGRGQRGWSALLASAQVVLLNTTVGEGLLQMAWSDGHLQTVRIEWLHMHAPRASPKIDPAPEAQHLREPWRRGGAIPEVDLAGAVGDGSASWRLGVLRTLRRHGAIVINGAPVDGDDAAQRRALDQVLQVDDSPYGHVFTTQGYGIAPEELAAADQSVSWLAGRVEGDAQQSLEPHTDQSFWPNPAGVLAFHMVEPASGGGGETVVADGLAAAEILRAEDPDGFAALAETNVEWLYIPEDGRIGNGRASAPVIKLDPASGAVVQLRWSNKDRGWLSRATTVQVPHFYRGYRRFASLLNEAPVQRSVRLEPGTFLLLDNWRVTHGRRSYVGKRSLKGAYILRRTWAGAQRMLEAAEATGELKQHDTPEPDIRTSLRRLDEGTSKEYAAQGPLWAALVTPSALTAQVLSLLRSMDGEHTRFGFRVNGYEHSLQTATRALRDGADEEMVVVALLHDVGEALFAANHGEIIAAMLRPFITERSYFVLKHHDLFQGYHYAHHFGLNRTARDALSDSPHYTACVYFTDAWDSLAFDPDYQSERLAVFEPMVARVLGREQYALTPDNPKNVVAWKETDLGVSDAHAHVPATCES